MLTRTRNALYCNPHYQNEVRNRLIDWGDYAPFTASERGRIAEAYQSEPQVPASDVALAIREARRARVPVALAAE